MTGDGDSGGLMASERQQGGGVVHGGNLGEVKPLRRQAAFRGQSSGLNLGLVGVGRRPGHGNYSALQEPTS